MSSTVHVMTFPNTALWLFFFSTVVLCMTTRESLQPRTSNESASFLIASSASSSLQLQINDQYVVMDNGIIQLNISKPEGAVTGISYNGVDNLLEVLNKDFNRGYWDLVWIGKGSTGKKGSLDRLEGTDFKVIVENEEQIEVSFSRTWNFSLDGKLVPLNIDKRFIVRDGSSGFYSYGIYQHAKGWPAFNLTNTRIAFKLRKDMFKYMAMADNRQRFMPLPDDREPDRGQALAYPEAVLLINPVEPEFQGEVDDKYSYSVENKDNRVHGWISCDPPIGFWQITPGDEFRSGGPLKQCLTSHVGPTNLAIFHSTHYSGEDLIMKFESDEEWNKVYGPVFMYLNSLSDGGDPLQELWEDAKNQMKVEVQRWPYDFVQSNEFPSSNQRGSISGRLLVHDRYTSKEHIPADGAFVGLASPGDVGSWQRESKGYQFWTRADKNGDFSIGNIREDGYNLYAWIPGFIGDYKYDVLVTITAGVDMNVGILVYEPPRDGPTLWEIGIPDRTAAEFYVPDPNPKYINKLYLNHPQKFRQYGLWERYTDLYSDTDLVYTIGLDDYKKDWFFAQVTRKIDNNTYQDTTWQIRFKLDNVTDSETYKLRIALATAHFSELQVRINAAEASHPLFTSGVIGKDNTIARHGIHGLYWLFNIDIPDENEACKCRCPLKFSIQGNNCFLRDRSGKLANHHVVMENGLVQVTLSKPDGIVTGIRYNGIDNLLEVLNEEVNRGYWDLVWSEAGSPGTTGTFDVIKGTKFRVIVENEEQVEISFTREWNPSLKDKLVPLNIDKRFIMLRNSSGFYSYAIYEHLKEWPPFNLPQTRITFKLRKEKFHYMAVADNRQRYMPLPDDRLPSRGRELAVPEAVLLVDPLEPEFKGQVDDKYEYSCDNKDLKVHGWICTDPPVGFWQITPSNEFRTGGPTKQNLTSHVGPTTLAMFMSAHYSGEDMVMKLNPDEAWKKVFGPVFIYFNSADQSDASNPPLHYLWEDAKSQMMIEEQSWPYSFPASNDFPPSDQRGCVSGRLLVKDTYISGDYISGNGAYVGLAPPGEVGSWQRECKGYQFWKRADENGYFSINDIRMGDYNLYAWVPGFIGDYRNDQPFHITAGCDVDVGDIVYEPPRDGPTLWDIGIPDRTAIEFYVPDPNPAYVNPLYLNHPERFRQYGLWERYTELYPNEDLSYTIGVSDYTKDWFFAQVTRKKDDGTYEGTTWQINFKLDNVSQGGTFVLRIALATANIAELQVRVNDSKAEPPVFTTGVIGKDNTITRHGIHGLYWLYNVDVPASLLVEGNNTIFLKQAMNTSPFQGIMYDYIRFEAPSSSANSN
ncbi:hypothetical protein FNV43_RR12453 [Rhamnella rubrinervis]|uniref:rhamnogalacturonan endolyase n=1 Tax=Rhamnella rubrinervis TaxID=2594499 RepID=A0A8K0H800_9ROSA|nr:hypothetical protein FNV43_RR12453 [Rhamnella rubrinervis]